MLLIIKGFLFDIESDSTMWLVCEFQNKLYGTVNSRYNCILTALAYVAALPTRVTTH